MADIYPFEVGPFPQLPGICEVKVMLGQIPLVLGVIPLELHRYYTPRVATNVVETTWTALLCVRPLPTSRVRHREPLSKMHS